MSAPTPCATADCGRPLTARQISHGSRYCSRRCHAQLRRKAPPSMVTNCLVCQKPLTAAQMGRRAEHCSIRCSMRTRYGRPAHTRTTCTECQGPLSRRQIWRRREYCSKGCVKAREWRHRPDRKRVATANSQATQRRAFIGRLRAFLATHSQAAAGTRGWRNGWSTARRRARVAGRVLIRRQHYQNVADLQAIATAAPSKAEAYRRCYAEAYRRAWAALEPIAA